MKLPWPPAEEKDWSLTTLQTRQVHYLPVLQLHHAYLAFRILGPEEPITLTLNTETSRHFILHANPNEWTLFPYPLESHAVGCFWDTLQTSVPCKVELAAFEWNLRQFRMRVLLDSEGYMMCAYKYNKNGQLITFVAYQDKPFVLSEEAYYFLPLFLRNLPPTQLHATGSQLPVKRLPEGRCFPWMKNGTQEQATYE